MGRALPFLFLLLPLLLSSCGDDDQPTRDGSSRDATDDATAPDGLSPDSPPDTSAADGRESDADLDAPASDAPPDVFLPDASEDAASLADGPVDAPVDASIDASVDANECVCGSEGATASECMGGLCSYTCEAARVDCNSATPPNGDGCECTTGGPGTNFGTARSGLCCSGGACLQAHSNGDAVPFQNTFWSCSPPGTYNETTARQAAAVWTPPGATEAPFTVTCGTGPSRIDVVCARSTATNGASAFCACWAYAAGSGAAASVGRVVYAATGTNACFCPLAAGGTTWQ